MVLCIRMCNAYAWHACWGAAAVQLLAMPRRQHPGHHGMHSSSSPRGMARIAAASGNCDSMALCPPCAHPCSAVSVSTSQASAPPSTTAVRCSGSTNTLQPRGVTDVSA